VSDLRRFVVEEGDWEIVLRPNGGYDTLVDNRLQKHGTHDQSSHNPHKGGRGSASAGLEYPTSKSNPELVAPLKDYVVQYPNGFGHRIVNRTLRDRANGIPDNMYPEGTEQLNDAVGSLDRLVELSPALPEATLTYRGIGDAFAKDLNTKGVGTTFTDNGFTSVSLDRNIAGGFPSVPSGNIMEIVLPAGTKAINPSKFFTSGKVGDTELTREKELILGRGTNFEILSIEDSPFGVGNLFKVGIKN